MLFLLESAEFIDNRHGLANACGFIALRNTDSQNCISRLSFASRTSRRSVEFKGSKMNVVRRALMRAPSLLSGSGSSCFVKVDSP